ncbi:hemerythrin domain-containing protein [Ideonella azotifigens]|nr:hemerythrin domain-containing protein [Ideonella azotifigens]MCD2344874.1 hemerythrin domain-containing protein [Ideonella azotifigens]
MNAPDHGQPQLLMTPDTAGSLAPHPAGPMLHPATLVILQEHSITCQLLDALAQGLAKHPAAEVLPDFDELRALLWGLEESPEQQHHRKESELLFPKLRASVPMTRCLLDRLDNEHAQGQRWLRELEHALLRFEMMGTSRRETFERLVRRYTLFQRAHMAAEEQQVLPLAEQFLAEHDWRELALAFPAGANQQAASATGCDCRSVLARLGAAARGPAVLRA